MSWKQKVHFVREPDMIQEIWIVFDCHKTIHTWLCVFPFRLCKFLVYLDVVRIQMKMWFKNMPQRLKGGSQLLTLSSKWFLCPLPHWVSYSINVPFCSDTHPPTRISVPQIFRVQIMYIPILSELLNPVKNSAFWWSMMTLKLSLKVCLHYSMICWRNGSPHKIFFFP